jgi:hypothetical protein
MTAVTISGCAGVSAKVTVEKAAPDYAQMV